MLAQSRECLHYAPGTEKLHILLICFQYVFFQPLQEEAQKPFCYTRFARRVFLLQPGYFQGQGIVLDPVRGGSRESVLFHQILFRRKMMGLV